MTVKVEITVTMGSLRPLALRFHGRGSGRGVAEALAVAIVDLLPVAGESLVDVIRASRAVVAGTVRVVLPGPGVGQTVAGDRSV